MGESHLTGQDISAEMSGRLLLSIILLSGWLASPELLAASFHEDSFNLQSHKTKHLVHHLRRLLGRRCHSALLIHEGNLDINDNCRFLAA